MTGLDRQLWRPWTGPGGVRRSLACRLDPSVAADLDNNAPVSYLFNADVFTGGNRFDTIYGGLSQTVFVDEGYANCTRRESYTGDAVPPAPATADDYVTARRGAWNFRADTAAVRAKYPDLTEEWQVSVSAPTYSGASGGVPPDGAWFQSRPAPQACYPYGAQALASGGVIQVGLGDGSVRGVRLGSDPAGQPSRWAAAHGPGGDAGRLD